MEAQGKRIHTITGKKSEAHLKVYTGRIERHEDNPDAEK